MARYALNGRKLREIRLSKGVGSKDLAQRAGVSERTLLEIEEGKRHATEETLFAVAQALGVKADELLAEDPTHAPARGGDGADSKATA